MSDPTIPPSDPTPTPTPPPASPMPISYAPVALPEGYIEPDPQQRSLAMVGYILGITLWVGPLIMFLIKKDDPTTSPWVKQELKKALNWGIMLQIVYFVCIPLNLLFCLGFLIIVGLSITNIVFVILNAMKANKGEAGSYPFIFPMVK